jgi:EmrB/QacA subfamily drug resistance transporter
VGSPDSIQANTPTAGADAAGQQALGPPESRKFVLVAAILASAMGFIDSTVVSLAMPAIRADLGATLVEAQWISNSYMLLLSALVLLGGAAGDVFGVRRTFIFGIAVFVVSSLACALAMGSTSLIVLRAAQGLGAAFMVPGSLAIIAKAYPASERGAAIGVWAAASSLTTALGPLLGGAVLSLDAEWAWRVVFALNVPIGVVALAMLLTRVPADSPNDGRRLDVAGAALATIALGALAWGLTSIGSPSDLGLPAWTWLIGGAMVFAIFIGWERYAETPLVKLGLFSSRAFTGANLYTLILFIAFNALFFFLPMTVVSAWNAPEWQASILFLPLSITLAILSGPAGRVADRIGPRLPLTLGAVVVGIAFATLTLTMPLKAFWSVTFPVLTLMGLGMAALVSPLSTAALAAAPEADSGLASGINNAVARAGGLLAVAALGAGASLVYSHALGGTAISTEFGMRSAVSLGAGAETVRVGAATAAFQWITSISAGLSFAAAAVAWVTQPSWRRAREATAGTS